MYYAEWLAWQINIATKEDREADDRYGESEGLSSEGVYENEYVEQLEHSRLSVSTTPHVRGPVYVFNDTVLELRCGMFEAWRGLVTLLSVTIVGVAGSFLLMTSKVVATLISEWGTVPMSVFLVTVLAFVIFGGGGGGIT